MAEWIEFTDLYGKRSIERIANIVSVSEYRSSVRVLVNYTFSDGTNFYDVDDSYDSVKEILMRGEPNG